MTIRGWVYFRDSIAIAVIILPLYRDSIKMYRVGHMEDKHPYIPLLLDVNEVTYRVDPVESNGWRRRLEKE